jgi:hypothetical protein
MVAGITGVNAGDVRNALSPEASKALVGFNSPTASYVTQPPGFRITMTLAAAGAQKIHMESIALIGKDRCMTVHFYAPQSQWEDYQPTFQQIAASFHLSPDQQASLGGFNWSRVGTSSFIGGMIGGGAGVVIWMLKRLGRGAA